MSADMLELLPLHYEENSLDRDRFKLKFDYAKYALAEKEGYLHVVTARDGAKLVGYYLAAILPHLHYCEAGLMASTDVYFLLKEYRQGNTGFKFVAFIEKSLAEKSVKKIYVSCKVHRDLQPFWEANGYRFSDKMFTKLLEQ